MEKFLLRREINLIIQRRENLIHYQLVQERETTYYQRE